MNESGVDLDFDILSPEGFDTQDDSEIFYELKSKAWPSDDSSTLGLLLDRKDPIKNMTNPMTRTNFKQQLQRQQLEQQDQLFHSQKVGQPDQPHSQSIAVPRTSSPTTLPPDVPSSVLQVKTQLENPTRYFIAQKQKRQLKEYLKTQGSPSAAGDLAVSSASQPTLNAINQQAVAALSSGQLVGQSGSPMAVMSPDGNHPTDVDNLLDDIISLESNAGVDDSLPWDATLTLGSVPQVATSNVFDLYNGLGMSTLIQGPAAASCPAVIKQESQELMLDQSFAKDRQKKDNHNMIERRRRFNINDRIKELGTLLPKQDSDVRQNKGTILKASVDYIRKLRREQDRMRQVEEEKRNTEELNRRLLLRVQELEMHARAHGIPTTPLTSDTTTALLSTILTSKPTTDVMQIKQEPVDGGCAATPCSRENQEPMEDYSLPSSCNPSPRSASMDDEMTD
ncbi:microphthalmia-associated transcription factor-like isoform X2 [Orbicella faveolata]|uniref:microphthalmia-associated transcription factor-like isoform X2 n=1 Tax=Orbicella faveolata TaxID=48498 RepID=UPI0009E4E644|nr:microphthalmia-associated transcription factor-like isoform X2 [Orbicella faveolata]